MSDAQSAIENPFPGPQPYRACDRRRFYGREALTKRLLHQVLARHITTLYGPSGAGKSSLMQAGVMPILEEKHDFRFVIIDGWPSSEKPLEWLLHSLYRQLDVGSPPTDKPLSEQLDEAINRADRRSDRPILIYLDQLEQLLFAGRDDAAVEAYIGGIDRLSRAPMQDLQIVLSLREDYLGRFRDRLRDRKHLLTHTFRVGPLSVAEMTKAVCLAATDGNPPQTWDETQLRGLITDVRVPGQAASDDAEVQSAYAQIVCRALFDERARHGRDANDCSIGAAAILDRYLDTTIEALGKFKETARTLLEEQFIDAEGFRTLLTEKEARLVLPTDMADEILERLEKAAILRAAEHQGSRYFELGHDWLARTVFERKKNRIAVEAEKQRQADEIARIGRERAARRMLMGISAAAVLGTIVLGVGLAWAIHQRNKAHRASLMANAREHIMRHQPSIAALMLLEVDKKAKARGWDDAAIDALSMTMPFFTSTAHEDEVWAGAWSPDGKRVATASRDTTIRVWNASGTGKTTAFAGHTEGIVSLSWNPDGTKFLSASHDKTARIWNAESPSDSIVLAGHDEPLTMAVWSRDGHRVLTASYDGTARIWNADGAGSPVVLKGHEKPVLFASFSPDGSHVVTASEDLTARVWDSDGKNPPVVLVGHTEVVATARWSSDGKQILTGSHDRTARIWNADGSGSAITLEGHRAPITDVAWTPDSKRVATASMDGSVAVFPAAGGDKPLFLTGHDSGVTTLEWDFDGKRLLTASVDRTARIWRLDDPGHAQVLYGHEGSVGSALWSPDNRFVLTVSRDRTARIWSTQDPVTPTTFGTNHGTPRAAWSPDGTRILTAHSGGVLQLWTPAGTLLGPIGETCKCEYLVAAWSPDGKRIAVGDNLARITLLNADKTGEPIYLKGHTNGVWAVAWSPDGKHIVSGSDDKSARIWDLDGKTDPVVLSGHGGAILTVDWSPDGRFIATGSADATIRRWNANGSGSPVILRGHNKMVTSVQFHPDSKHLRLLSTSADTTVRLWTPMDADKPQMRLLSRMDGFFSASWSPDGDRVVTTCADNNARIWNIDGKGIPTILEGHKGIVVTAAFSPDGKRLVTASHDGSARIWLVDNDLLAEALQNATTDCLTPEQRQLYLEEDEREATADYETCERRRGR